MPLQNCSDCWKAQTASLRVKPRAIVERFARQPNNCSAKCPLPGCNATNCGSAVKRT